MSAEPGGSVPRPTTRAEAVRAVTTGFAWTLREPPEMLDAYVRNATVQEHCWEALRLAAVRRMPRDAVENLAQVALGAREFDVCWDDVLPALKAARERLAAVPVLPGAPPTLRLIRGGKRA